ncbi:MAG: hypothetical protein ACOH2A_00620 [Sphingobacteriaceae bacterium]
MNYNEKRDFFTGLITNPAAVHKVHATQLEILIHESPYCNILHALLASAYREGNTPDFEMKLQTAAAYAPNHEVLYQLIHRADQLAKPNWDSNVKNSPIENRVEAFETEKGEASDEQTQPERIGIELVDHNEIVPVPVSALNETESSPEETSEPQFVEPIEETPPVEIDDEVYEEIVGIENIRIEPVAVSVMFQGLVEESLTVINQDDETEKLILGNIAASNYFALSGVLGEDIPEPLLAEPVVFEEEKIFKVIGSEKQLRKLLGSEKRESHQTVTKYHDEKMPYSFMWWLDKTRKEHADTYQPYANFKLDTTVNIRKNPDSELQHQYIENIFHLNTIEDLEGKSVPQTTEFNTKRKEDRIIERFIQEEPQIKPPSGEKLDTENKAKKSADDNDELVTETLARVYIDQMLYQKALDTYKKLALKFPEKRRYFASQIEILERKIN